MIKTNYHTHSCYCDGKGKIREYIETAISKGFTHLGFSGHAPVPFDNTFAISQNEYKNYCNEISLLKEEYRDRIKIFLGLEIDYIPGILDNFSTLINEGNLDYCIGSVHLVNKNNDNNLWFIDGNKQETYDEGLNRVFGGDIKTAVKAFFRQTNDMLVSQRPDILGHFNKVVMHNKERYFKSSDKWFIDLVCETLEIVKSTGCVCEINTRGLYKGRYNDYYPSKDIIHIMNTMEIPVVVSTDAHCPDDLDKYEGVFEFLKAINYRHVVYLDKIWREIVF
ncbi:MAG: histidinol-phosphatase [Bacteroidales bacterium]|nr:histidinol-phosphatase [Bacteroidales bacterium]